MKGIATVISVILLLLITIAMTGFAFVFFYRTAQSSAGATEAQLENQVNQAGVKFKIEGVSQNQVYVRNRGTAPLKNLAFYANNIIITYTGPASLQPGETGTYSLDSNQLSGLSGPVPLRASGGFASDEIIADFGGGLPLPGDTTPPVRSNGLPSGTLSAGTTSATLSLTTNEAATCKYATTAGTSYSLMINTFTTTGGTSHSATVSGLANGNTYTYFVRCSDQAGNANTADFTITFSVANPGGDTTPPTTSVTSPANGATVSSIVTVTATASDNVAVSYVELYKDNLFFSNDTASPYQYTWNTSLDVNGAHTLNAKAVDSSRNSASSTTITVTVNNAVTDTTPPTVSITSPAAGQTVSSTVAITAVASDNVGVAGVQFKVDGANVGAEDTSAPYSVLWNSSGVSNGSHTISAVARDVAGNSAASTAIAVVVNNAPPPPGITPAFLGAMGSGATAKGGRGGVVMEVTNLNDGGSGSFRACAEGSGPRTCVFRVGGTISLLSGITVFNPYLTVAGQTAPGGGIQIDGRAWPGNTIQIQTHDVIFRYVRIRPGFNGVSAGAQAALNVGNFGIRYNIIIDHVSLEWIDGKFFTVWDNDGSSDNVTLQWSLLAEPFVTHSTNMHTGGFDSPSSCAITNFDGHHNLLMTASHRNPLLKSAGGHWVNNIVYNWARYAYQQVGGGVFDLIGNLFKKGPISSGIEPWEFELASDSGVDACNGSPSVYLSGNKGFNQADPNGNQWVMAQQLTGENGIPVGPVPAGWQRSSPQAAGTFPIAADSVNNLESIMLLTVGASQRLDCNGNWVANRDPVDARLINQYTSNTGGAIPTTENDVGGFPFIAGGTPCADSDRDGMPDAWETAKGLNPNSASDGALIAQNGYTNLENYLNGN